MDSYRLHVKLRAQLFVPRETWRALRALRLLRGSFGAATWRRQCFYVIIAGFLLQHLSHVSAQPYVLPNANPTDWDDIENVLRQDIPGDLNQAQCGGWNFQQKVNGVWSNDNSTRENLCPPAKDEPLRAKCRTRNGTLFVKIAQDAWSYDNGASQITDSDMDQLAAKTIPAQGLISLVKGVPGRDTQRAFGNIRSGLGVRKNEGGNYPEVSFSPGSGRREPTGELTGFDYPNNVGTCGLTTVCRPPGHPDARALPPAGYQNTPRRDRAGFLCEHPCQRPLDDSGKPQNWDETDASAARCGRQETDEDGIAYACGGKETLGPGEGFCGELQQNGPLAGLCQDLNSWVYIRWEKLVHVCLVPIPQSVFVKPVLIYLYQKGSCGFPEEVGRSENSQIMIDDNWEEEGVYECCSDGAYSVITEDQYPYPGSQYNDNHVGTSCKACVGDDCRLFPDTNTIIINDGWYEPFPTDLPGVDASSPGCQTEIPQDPAALFDLINSLGNLGIDPQNPKVNIGKWNNVNVDVNMRKLTQRREYISFFRDYNDASYERADHPNATDDNKKQHIPVACYGMYDMSPEDALPQATAANDKRCTIGAYYNNADDGDGDAVSFARMKYTQAGKGTFRENLDFNNPIRPFDRSNDLWFPQLGNAFSLLNDEVFGERYHEDYSFALLTTDSARQRATEQLDRGRPMSSGAVLRTPDDTITAAFDLRKERRTITEWWHMAETQMHKNFTPPTVRMLLPSTWSIDLNPLDPLFTPPPPPGQGERSPDIRSETIEVQVQASENLLGTIAGFLEHALLLRVESEPIPIVVPIINPTELRAIAQGWETWASAQEDHGLPNPTEARRVAAQLNAYADRADDVRALRGELARYIGTVLFEQRKVSKRTAQWVTDNIEAYRAYLFFDWGTSLVQYIWSYIENQYRILHDVDAFPWCRNDRFTSPIYSLLDPWLPGRANEGDTSAGMVAYKDCVDEIERFRPLQCPASQDLTACSAAQLPHCDTQVFGDYIDCIAYVQISKAQKESEGIEGTWPTMRVCERFFPQAPLLPHLPKTIRSPDIILDFTAFREMQKHVVIPVLKPIQIRMEFDRIKPPSLNRTDESPVYPQLADLPALPTSFADTVKDALPKVVIPSDHSYLDLFSDPAVLALSEDDPFDQFPKIAMPTMDLLQLINVLYQIYFLIGDKTTFGSMHNEYNKFWGSLTLDNVKKGTEQDCVRPYNDPYKKCVHFEFDLKERLQRISARPAVQLLDDFRSHGLLRGPIIHGQTYCEREDWACQLLNATEKKPRDGWMLDLSDGNRYDPDVLIEAIRQDVREQSDNIIQNEDDRFLYDIPQEEMYENFRIFDAERLERRIERFEPAPLGPDEECNDYYCTQ